MITSILIQLVDALDVQRLPPTDVSIKLTSVCDVRVFFIKRTSSGSSFGGLFSTGASAGAGTSRSDRGVTGRDVCDVAALAGLEAVAGKSGLSDLEDGATGFGRGFSASGCAKRKTYVYTCGQLLDHHAPHPYSAHNRVRSLIPELANQYVINLQVLVTGVHCGLACLNATRVHVTHR